MPTVKPQQKGAVTFIQISILFLCFLSIIAIIVGLYANIFFSAGLSYLVVKEIERKKNENWKMKNSNEKFKQ